MSSKGASKLKKNVLAAAALCALLLFSAVMQEPVVADGTDGTLVYVGEQWEYWVNGQIDTTYTGLAYHENTNTDTGETEGNWYYVEGGVLNWGYTGIVSNDGGVTLYYVENGIWNKDYEGIVSYEGRLYRFEQGVNSEGVSFYEDKLYFFDNGVMNNFNGRVYWNGEWCPVEDGVVKENTSPESESKAIEENTLSEIQEIDFVDDVPVSAKAEILCDSEMLTDTGMRFGELLPVYAYWDEVTVSDIVLSDLTSRGLRDSSVWLKLYATKDTAEDKMTNWRLVMLDAKTQTETVMTEFTAYGESSDLHGYWDGQTVYLTWKTNETDVQARSVSAADGTITEMPGVKEYLSVGLYGCVYRGDGEYLHLHTMGAGSDSELLFEDSVVLDLCQIEDKFFYILTRSAYPMRFRKLTKVYDEVRVGEDTQIVTDGAGVYLAVNDSKHCKTEIWWIASDAAEDGDESKILGLYSEEERADISEESGTAEESNISVETDVSGEPGVYEESGTPDAVRLAVLDGIHVTDLGISGRYLVLQGDCEKEFEVIADGKNVTADGVICTYCLTDGTMKIRSVNPKD